MAFFELWLFLLVPFLCGRWIVCGVDRLGSLRYEACRASTQGDSPVFASLYRICRNRSVRSGWNRRRLAGSVGVEEVPAIAFEIPRNKNPQLHWQSQWHPAMTSQIGVLIRNRIQPRATIRNQDVGLNNVSLKIKDQIVPMTFPDGTVVLPHQTRFEFDI